MDFWLVAIGFLSLRIDSEERKGKVRRVPLEHSSCGICRASGWRRGRPLH